MTEKSFEPWCSVQYPSFNSHKTSFLSSWKPIHSRFTKLMEKESGSQSKGEMTVPQFRQQLNQWFEEHGVLDNLRSHLRSLMITAIQHSEISLKAHQKTSPKSQSIDLLVAEYLLKHGCHYTLSILMSELPCLANFCSGKLYLCSGPNAKSKAKYHFQDSEVIEIMNCLGLPKLVETGYSQSKEESLLECLLRLLPKIQLKENCKKAAEEEKKNVEKEDYGKMMRELCEREKRIQEYLRRHKEEMLEQLQIAERNLDTRREAIEKEVTERQLRLGRIAYQWKDKHEEIMALSKHFMVLKTENKSLQARLDDMETEMNQLKLEVQEKTSVIENLEAEKLFLKSRVREYLKLTNKETKNEKDNTSDQNNVLSHGIFSKGDNTLAVAEGGEKNQTPNLPGCPGDGFSLSDTSLSEEALLEKVKLRLRVLEDETFRISEKYLKYRKKYDDDDDDDLNLTSVVSDVIVQECSKTLSVEEGVKERVQLGNVSKKETALQVNLDSDCIQKLPETQSKKKVVYTEDKTLLHTKRQEQNREYYRKSRQFLGVLEKSLGLACCSSTSTADVSLSYSLSSDSLKSMIEDEVVEEQAAKKESEKLEHNSERKVQPAEERKNQDLTDKECLILLQEATHSYLKTFEKEDEVHINS